MLTIAVLGPVEVFRDGMRVAVPSGKSTEVLVRLALDAGTPVRAEQLIDDVWGESAARTGRNTLQSKVSQLRKVLGDAIRAEHGGYTLAVSPDAIDALRVAHLAETATGLLRSDPASASDAAAAGLALFRGPVLASAGEGDWLAPQRARLTEIRLGLLEDQLAAEVELGGGGAVIGRLEALVAENPLRERLWHSLITALYRAGRQADALAAYTKIRAILAGELGVDPGPELQELERGVLRHNESLLATTPHPRPRIGNLPRIGTDLVGRGTELGLLHRVLEPGSLVTLLGPGGIGKTRLAIETARTADLSGGAWLIRLEHADPSTDLELLVAETLGLSGTSQLADRLAGAATLLVLDNCEQVADAVAELADRLLDAAPGLRLLATSQHRLGAEGEHVVGLDPLPPAEAVELFAARAAQWPSDIARGLDPADPAVADICRYLDGLPLAIELAAARIRTLSLTDIAQLLGDRFTLLRDPSSTKPERRRALRATIEWSYELLDESDRHGLWVLAGFTGGARLDAFEHVLPALDVDEAALDVVARLVDRSLVTVTESGTGTTRYGLLDSIREFALDASRTAGRDAEISAAHAGWLAEVADETVSTVRGPAQAQRVVLAREERLNIDAALGWCANNDPLLGLRIANGFGWAWVVLGDGVAGAVRVRDALDAADGQADPRDRVLALSLSGWLEASAGDVERAGAELDEALRLAESVGDVTLVADVERHLAFQRLMQGQFADALVLAEGAEAVNVALGRPWEEAASLLLGASAAMMLGDSIEAAHTAERAVTELRPLDDAWGMVHGQAILGAIAQAEGRFDSAAKYLATAADESDRLGFAGQAAYHRTSLGRVQQQSGDAAARATLERARAAATDSKPARAAARLTAVLAAARSAGDAETEVLTLDALARIAADDGRTDAAIELLGEADARRPQAVHLVDEIDRVDAGIARGLVLARTAKPT
ncbi:BTAD domain-containing putative transcriptional regulator [Aldersonia kunmingensis]|uniref:BTAD domain-containing putative transcriptional regulator n=1 Tax=Aldersonia kunmingensis TaxID=408066 RepID=UPI000831B0BB|nr:BTAD domain-containing putative transcriptional regulator [Aldersonia kunmingensis]